jgi:DNA-binding transcriptional ArsR family regulator
VAGRAAHIETAELFRLLGDPTRLAILHALLEICELCVCDIARLTGVAENLVSQALRVVRAAGVVRTRRDGRRIHYRLADAHVRMLLELSADHVRHGANQAHSLGAGRAP